ncbi:uncharacterized protein EAF02_003903 [Botrytis sinoallii]|uniref:uncharacterized protein n=1 Tax=Botrytis sinoallii TaxID=1463999 RepID=UPI0018FF3097|nr:uncharacterized protein EAF02_003903 [Botrytis sinoallii]KAF7887256.1 hypothetical protein EAF02_003903 [Botrytis sinoallii]
MATQNACDTIPPVTKVDYKIKGAWETIAGIPVYVSGASKPTNALMVIYDVFGAAPQTLQGADLLAAALEPLNIVVIVPDLFDGKKAQAEWFKDPSEEARVAKAAFMEFISAIDRWEKLVGEVVADCGKKWDGVNAWACLGLCWGGKVAAATSRKGTPWTVSGQVHPSRLTKEDAERITIPHIVLASNGEDAKAVQEYKDVLEAGNGVVETYSTMHHGWMGARANFEMKTMSRNMLEGINSVRNSSRNT